MSKHTRGPWRSQGWVPTWAYIPVHDASHNLVASFYPHEAKGYTRDQVEANARLAAAAPDLLEALNGLVGEATEVWGYAPDYPDIATAIAAIKRATEG